MDKPNQESNYRLSYALARIGLGVNISLHGLTRLPQLRDFANGMVNQFSGTVLPSWTVLTAGYMIPIAETLIGLAVLLGLFTREALAAGMLKMIFLLFGICLLQNWGTAGSQLVYLGFYGVLLATVRYNSLALDCLRQRKD